MRFFNTKEEVIDIQLTPYGKHLLSKGKWNPVYYEFYDDDIIYDSSYAGTEEGQEEITERIKNTKRARTQYTFSSPDSGPSLNQEEMIEKRKSIKSNFLPLGQSSLIENLYPAMKIKFIAGEIEGVSSNSAEEEFKDFKVIKSKDLSYKIGKGTIEQSGDSLTTQTIYEDGSFIEVTEQDLFLDITEVGIDNKSDNFEISFVEVDDYGKEKSKVYFVDEQTPTKVNNNVLVDNENYEEYRNKLLNEYFETKEYINYFFDVKIDKEIDESVLCRHLSKEEILRLKIVEGYDIACDDSEDITALLSTNPSTLITEGEEQ